MKYRIEVRNCELLCVELNAGEGVLAEVGKLIFSGYFLALNSSTVQQPVPRTYCFTHPSPARPVTAPTTGLASRR